MNTELKDAGKQESHAGLVDLPPLNHESTDHMQCTDEHMNNSTTENKPAVRHALQNFEPMDTHTLT